MSHVLEIGKLSFEWGVYYSYSAFWCAQWFEGRTNRAQKGAAFSTERMRTDTVYKVNLFSSSSTTTTTATPQPAAVVLQTNRIIARFSHGVYYFSPEIRVQQTVVFLDANKLF